MRTNHSFSAAKIPSKTKCGASRNLAMHHAIGIGNELSPEKKRVLELAVLEAEALACQTGVPELVLLSLAEEKVRATRKWLAKQEQLKTRSPQWQLAA